MEIHWEWFIGSCSEWNRKGEIWKKTKEKTRKKHTKTKKMSEHVGKNAFHMSHKPICFSIDHLWRVLLHEGEALIVSQKKRTPRGCLVRGQLAQMTLCYIFGRGNMRIQAEWVYSWYFHCHVYLVDLHPNVTLQFVVQHRHVFHMFRHVSMNFDRRCPRWEGF